MIMIECPNCGNKELPGALFCRECGAQLIGVNGLSTQTIQGGLTDKLAESLKPAQQTQMPPPAPTEAAVSLYLIENGDVLPLEGRTEFTLGRSTEGQPILPDIDLAPYHAYENGVSRLHASITIGKQQALATDLGSANGTRLNGQKLPPHKPYPIKHGDILILGKLKIQLLIRR
jgi:pSer/pThr/pTyr-binding forkhead associated (FHA) protein